MGLVSKVGKVVTVVGVALLAGSFLFCPAKLASVGTSLVIIVVGVIMALRK